MESPSPVEWFNTELEEFDNLEFILDCPMIGDMADQNISVHGDELCHHSLSSESKECCTSFPATKNDENAYISISPLVTDSLHEDLTGLESPAEQIEGNGGSHTSWSSSLTKHFSMSSFDSQVLLSFENPNPSPTGSTNKNDFHEHVGNGNQVVEPKQTRPAGPTHSSSASPLKESLDAEHCASNANEVVGTKRSRHGTRSPPHARDHIMAERLRREKLAQLFIALSALIPGLKKVDKASVLEDSIKYVKQLQERVNVLEEDTRKKTIKSVMLVMKNNPSVSSVEDDNTSSCDETSPTQINHGRFADDSLPQVEAKIADKQLLVRVHCQRRKGVLTQILNALESFHLSILSSSVLPFGDLSIDITIIAKMESEFSVAVIRDLVGSLQQAL